MGSKKLNLSPKAALPFRTANKQRRQELFVKQLKARSKQKREKRGSRKKEEDKNPKLRAERVETNVPATIERKRVWDELDSDNEDVLGLAIDVERLKRQKVEDDEPLVDDIQDSGSDEDYERDSMIDSGSGSEDDEAADTSARETRQEEAFTSAERSSSPTRSIASTNLSLAPENLAEKFPSLFGKPRQPKVLITTSINSTLYKEAETLTTLFPSSVFIRRSSHRYGHKYSVKEIAKFASNRNYTAVVVLIENQKKPSGLDVRKVY